jgi:hypothetical protein
VKCPIKLQEVAGKSGEDWLLMAHDWGVQYQECATRHSGLVDAVNKFNADKKAVE